MSSALELLLQLLEDDGWPLMPSDDPDDSGLVFCGEFDDGEGGVIEIKVSRARGTLSSTEAELSESQPA